MKSAHVLRFVACGWVLWALGCGADLGQAKPGFAEILPVDPTGLTVERVGSEATLRWQDLSDNEWGFRVERSTEPDGRFVLVALVEPNGTRYVDTDLIDTTHYFYTVRAYNEAGYSEATTPVIALGSSAQTPSTPNTPTTPSTPSGTDTTSTPASQPTTPQPPQPSFGVTSLTLINADTDQPIAGFDPLANNAVLDFSALGTQNLSIRANVIGTVGSVKFTLDGTELRNENNAPYALAGDVAGPDYNAWTPTVGAHVLVVTGYELTNGGGAVGRSITLNFTAQP